MNILNTVYNLHTPLISFSFFLDGLALFYLILIIYISLYVLLFTFSYYSDYRHPKLVLALMLLFILSMVAVVVSRDVVSFIISWELMSVTSFGLVLSQGNVDTGKPAMLYLIMTGFGTACIMAAFIGLAIQTHSLEFAAYHGVCTLGLLALAVVGFLAKAGAVPLHIWLPEAHPVAPSNVSALMSGVMVKIALYGLCRFLFEFAPPLYPEVGIIILMIGAVSALLGVSYALIQNNIKKMLAYSTIENIGIILMGLGLAYWADTQGHNALCALALLASFFHTLNHGLFKSILFMGAGVIHKYTHSTELAELGGLAKRMPIFAGLMLVACMAIAALPPLNGFFSEWLLYISLVQAVGIDPSQIGYYAMLAIALLALTGALAAACFVKMYGLTFLGQSHSEATVTAPEPNLLELVALTIPAVTCGLLGIYPYKTLQLIAGWLQPLTGTDPILLPLTPLHITGSTLTFQYIPLVLFAMLALAFLLTVICRKISFRTSTRVGTTWACGLSENNPRAQMNATGFSAAIRRVFSMFYQTAEIVHVDESRKKYFQNKIHFQEEISDLFDALLYRPLVTGLHRISQWIGIILESGQLQRDIAALFTALILSLMVYWEIS